MANFFLGEVPQHSKQSDLEVDHYVEQNNHTQKISDSEAFTKQRTGTAKEMIINKEVLEQDASSTTPLDRRVPRVARRHTSIVHIPDTAPVHQVNMVSFLSGLAAGVAQAGLFNPFDRALYLSVKNQIPFLSQRNFQSPYQGFFQSVGHRALSGGLYYPLEHFFVSMLPPEAALDTGSSGALYNFAAGTAAGSVNAVICNPISAVKYKTWSREVSRGMVREALDMLRIGGIRPFCNGLIPTVARDLVFGGIYTFLRFELQYRLQLGLEYQYVANFTAATLATILSGPLNLARNVQYATSSRHVADSVRDVLAKFSDEIFQRPSWYEKCRHVQNRLRIGWGTARVALGMTFGHYVYDTLVGIYEVSSRPNLKQAYNG